MGTLIKGGEVITAVDRYKADVYVENGVITQIAKDIKAGAGDIVVDATG